MVSSYQLPKIALCIFLGFCFLMALLYYNSEKHEAWLREIAQEGNYMPLYRAQDQVIVDEIRGKNVDKMSEKDAMEFFYRVIAMPQQGICRSLKRVGGKWTNSIGVDGDKFVCMDTFVDGSECLVYSFGIANDWTFEDFIVKFGCSVFAYDPTVNFPSKRGQNIYFEKKGLADFYSSTMNTLHNFQKHNGHLTKQIKYLKIDIESHELEGLPEWLSSGALETVEQLAMELHLTKLHEGPKFKGLVSILQELYKLNFRLISYQVNLVARTMRDNHYTLMEVVFMKDNVWNYEENSA